VASDSVRMLLAYCLRLLFVTFCVTLVPSSRRTAGYRILRCWRFGALDVKHREQYRRRVDICGRGINRAAHRDICVAAVTPSAIRLFARCRGGISPANVACGCATDTVFQAVNVRVVLALPTRLLGVLRRVATWRTDLRLDAACARAFSSRHQTNGATDGWWRAASRVVVTLKRGLARGGIARVAPLRIALLRCLATRRSRRGLAATPRSLYRRHSFAPPVRRRHRRQHQTGRWPSGMLACS